jgi:hypothetical protein
MDVPRLGLSIHSFKIGSRYIARSGPELLGSSGPPASAF